MLGKLIKNEIKQTFRSVSTIYIVVAVIAAVLIISSLMGITVFKALSSMGLFLSGIVMMVMTVVAIIKNFNDSLYGRQGYLSFSLPVKCQNLLFSKILVSILWLVCAVTLMGLIYLIMYLSMTSENGIEAIGSLKSLIETMGLSEIFPSKGLVIELMFLVAIGLLINFIVLIGFVYFSVTVANTRPLQAHPKAYGILIFLASYILINGISEPITEKLPLALHVTTNDIIINFTAMTTEEGALFSYGIGGTIFKGIVAIGLLVFTGWIMENKVNVK